MTTVLLAFVVVAMLMMGMAIGVLAGRKPISGSCGGMKALGMEVECEICGGNPQLCDTDQSSTQSSDQSKGTNVVQTFDPDHKTD